MQMQSYSNNTPNVSPQSNGLLQLSDHSKILKLISSVAISVSALTCNAEMVKGSNNKDNSVESSVALYEKSYKIDLGSERLVNYRTASGAYITVDISDVVNKRAELNSIYSEILNLPEGNRSLHLNKVLKHKYRFFLENYYGRTEYDAMREKYSGVFALNESYLKRIEHHIELEKYRY